MPSVRPGDPGSPWAELWSPDPEVAYLSHAGRQGTMEAPGGNRITLPESAPGGVYAFALELPGVR